MKNETVECPTCGLKFSMTGDARNARSKPVDNQDPRFARTTLKAGIVT